MATIKHISSKNANYSAAELYLTFEHDEFSNKPIRDAQGRLIPRANYRLETVLCGEENFAIACMRANLRYGKNNHKGDVKSHHYIISFDPRDAVDNGLTVDRAQELGVAFCKKHFPGHQALVCTHPDGHNHSGNIHVHIVINSLRIEEVPFLPYMDRPCDTQPGMKHRCTSSSLRYLRSEVMEMCHRENLYQIDLLNGSKNRISDKEYHAQRRGQMELDKQNTEAVAARLPVVKTKFDTDKDRLRAEIRAALSVATSFEDFTQKLLRRGITVKESRGRFSYLTADRTKPITSRRLGDDFSKEAVLAQIERNAEKKIREIPVDNIAQPSLNASASVIPSVNQNHSQQSDIQKIVDMDYAASKGAGYVHWAKRHNLKAEAKTLLAYQQAGFQSPEELATAISDAHESMLTARKKVKDLEAVIGKKKELQTHVQVFLKTAPTIAEYEKLPKKSKQDAFRQAHQSDFILREAAIRYFKTNGFEKVPSGKKLQSEIENLISEKISAYTAYHDAQDEEKKLRTIQANLEKMLQKIQPEQAKEISHERND